MPNGITKGIELHTLYKVAAEAWYHSDVSIDHMKLQAEKVLNLAFVTATKRGLRIVDNNTRDECSLVLEGGPEFIALGDAILDAISGGEFMSGCQLISTGTTSVGCNEESKVIERSVLYIAAAKAYALAANRLEDFWMAPSKLLDLAILISKQQEFEFREDSVADYMFCCMDERFFTLFYKAALTHMSNVEICDARSNDLSISIYKAVASDYYKAH